MTSLNIIESAHEGYAKNRRASKLASHLNELLPEGCSLLDVGTGDGLIAYSVKQNRPEAKVEGLEFQVREECLIPVLEFDGKSIPLPDNSFDYVSFIDVLHHTEDPLVLLKEAVRVAKRGILLKDHNREGLFANSTLRFMDQVGNRRYNIPLPYNYLSPEEWKMSFEKIGVKPADFRVKLGIYPWWGDLIFGRKLHFFARLDKIKEAGE